MHKRVQALVVAGIISANTISSSVSAFADEIANSNDELQVEGESKEPASTEGESAEDGSSGEVSEEEVTPQESEDENTDETLQPESNTLNVEESQEVEETTTNSEDVQIGDWFVEPGFENNDYVVITRYAGEETEITMPAVLETDYGQKKVKLKDLDKSMFPAEMTSLTISAEEGQDKVKLESDSLVDAFNKSSIQHIDLSGLDVSQVTSMTSLFMECRSLKTINVTGWEIGRAHV